MNCNVFLFVALCLSLVCVLLLSIKLRRVQESLSVIKEALEDGRSEDGRIGGDG